MRFGLDAPPDGRNTDNARSRRRVSFTTRFSRTLVCRVAGNTVIQAADKELPVRSYRASVEATAHADQTKH